MPKSQSDYITGTIPAMVAATVMIFESLSVVTGYNIAKQFANCIINPQKTPEHKQKPIKYCEYPALKSIAKLLAKQL